MVEINVNIIKSLSRRGRRRLSYIWYEKSHVLFNNTYRFTNAKTIVYDNDDYMDDEEEEDVYQ